MGANIQSSDHPNQISGSLELDPSLQKILDPPLNYVTKQTSSWLIDDISTRNVHCTYMHCRRITVYVVSSRPAGTLGIASLRQTTNFYPKIHRWPKDTKLMDLAGMILVIFLKLSEKCTSPLWTFQRPCNSTPRSTMEGNVRAFNNGIYFILFYFPLSCCWRRMPFPTSSAERGFNFILVFPLTFHKQKAMFVWLESCKTCSGIKNIHESYHVYLGAREIIIEFNIQN
jgi:hypothetical protein